MTYRLATTADRPALIELLQQVDLLTDDLPDELGTFTLAFDKDTLAGASGLDVFGPIGLLRSVAVLPSYQRQRIGRHLIELSEELARQRGITNLYLITTAADGYFERLGFERIDRLNVPDAISKTRQFSDLCPASSVVMVSRPKLALRN